MSTTETFLDGIKVLDFSRVLAGPLATQILADYGAEVLKVEPPWGDDTRQWGPPFQGTESAYYQSANRNKASLILNLKDEPDRQRAQELIGVADVVVDNFLPRVRHKLGLSGDGIRQKHPSLVTLSVVGYHGSRSDDPGYDLVLQAESGYMGMTGPAEGLEHKVGVAVVDVLTGIMASSALLAALVRRGRTGEGAGLTISLFQTALFSLVNVASNHLVTGAPTKRWGNDHPNLVPYGAYPTGDGSIVIGVGNDRQYAELLHSLGLAESSIAGFSNAVRVKNRQEIREALEGVLAHRSGADVIRDLKKRGVPVAAIHAPHEALAAAATWNTQSLVAVERTDGTLHHSIANPVQGLGLRRDHSCPPRLGEGGEDLAARWLSPRE